MKIAVALLAVLLFPSGVGGVLAVDRAAEPLRSESHGASDAVTRMEALPIRTGRPDTTGVGAEASRTADPEPASDALTIGGFVMNETFSVVGSDFYAAFYSTWSEPESAEMYTVSVREEPAPRFGARLTVEIGDTVIFRTFLRPNNQKIQRAARQAVRRAQIYLKKHYEPREVY